MSAPFELEAIALAVFPACVAAQRPREISTDDPGWREKEAADAAFRYASAFVERLYWWRVYGAHEPAK